MIEGNENIKTALDDDAAIYSNRTDESAKKRFKDLQGKEKWQYFKDYMLAKTIGILIAIGCVIYFVVKMFSPKAELIYSVAIADCPFTVTTVNTLREDFTSMIVTDTDTQEIRIDDDYYVSSDAVNARMKIMALISAGEIDCMIMPEEIYEGYSSAEIYSDLYDILPAETLSKYEEQLVYHAVYTGRDDDNLNPIYSDTEEYCCAIDVSEGVAKLAGAQLNCKYYLVSIANSQHPEYFDDLLELLMP